MTSMFDEWLFSGDGGAGDVSLAIIICYIVYKGLSFLATNAVDYFKTKDREDKQETAELKLAAIAYQKEIVEYLKARVADLEDRVATLEKENHDCEIKLAAMRKEIEIIKKSP